MKTSKKTVRANPAAGTVGAAGKRTGKHRGAGWRKGTKAEGKAAALEFWILTAMLALTGEERKALALIAEWEGDSVAEYLRWALFTLLDLSSQQMQSMAVGLEMQYHQGPEARKIARAKRFLKRVRPLLPEKGWQQ